MRFREYVESTNWNVVYQEENPDIGYETFERRLKDCYDETIPLREIKPPSNHTIEIKLDVMWFQRIMGYLWSPKVLKIKVTSVSYALRCQMYVRFSG